MADFLTGFQAGANLALRAKDLQMQREAHRLQAQQILQQIEASRALDAYRQQQMQVAQAEEERKRQEWEQQQQDYRNIQEWRNMVPGRIAEMTEPMAWQARGGVEGPLSAAELGAAQGDAATQVMREGAARFGTPQTWATMVGRDESLRQSAERTDLMRERYGLTEQSQSLLPVANELAAEWLKEYGDILSKDPSARPDFAELHGRMNRAGMGPILNTPGFKSLIAQKRLEAGQMAPKASGHTADYKFVQEVQDLDRQIADARNAGDTTKVDALTKQRDMLVQARTKTETFEITPQGVTIRRGSMTGPPSAQATEVSKAAEGAVEAVSILDSFKPFINDATVGTGPWLMKTLVDGTPIADLFPGSYNASRTELDTKVKLFNVKVLKALKTDSQMSDRERKDIVEMLPDPGALTSVAEFENRVDTLRKMIVFTKHDAMIRNKVPLPDELLTIHDVQTRIKNGTYKSVDEAMEHYNKSMFRPYKFEEQPK